MNGARKISEHFRQLTVNSGRLIINPQFEDASKFSEGLAAVQFGGKLGYIDTTRRFAVNPQFELERRSDASPACAYDFSSAAIDSRFSGGLAAVRVGKKWGYIDKGGQFVIEPQFDDAGPFDGPLALVIAQWDVVSKWACIPAKEGYIDRNGRYVYTWNSKAQKGG